VGIEFSRTGEIEFSSSLLALCPAASWHKSGAVNLSEAKDPYMQINCIDPSRPEATQGDMAAREDLE
jgi:hypothetical protein